MARPIDRRRFGEFVTRKREELGLSQAALSSSVGISRPYLSQIEAGVRMPGDDVFQKLLAMLGAPMTEFITEVVGEAFQPDQQEAALRLVAPLQYLAERLPPDELREFLDMQASLEQMAADIAQLGDEPIQVGPEGWANLNKEDRRLVQRMVNRLLKSHGE